jgi:hypothetical protein
MPLWHLLHHTQGRVTAHSSVADHTLADLLAAAASSAASTSSSSGKPGGAKSGSSKTGSKKGATAAAPSSATKSTAGEGDTSAPAGPLPVLLLIDTAGCGFEEEQEEEGDSKGNPGEAKAVMAHVQRLLRSGLAPGDIGIITPYNAQVGVDSVSTLHGWVICCHSAGRLLVGQSTNWEPFCTAQSTSSPGQLEPLLCAPIS